MNLIVRLILLAVVLSVFGVCFSKTHDRKRKVKNSRRGRSTSELLLRLLYSEDYGMSELELYSWQGFGVVCSTSQDKHIADIACRKLGFLRGAEKVSAGRYTGYRGSTPYLNIVYCSFWAQNLNDCYWETVPSCPTGNTVRVVCLQNEVLRSRDDVSVRLMDGTRLSGRVEVKYKGEWGVICDDNWDDKDASVVCKMLGFHGESKALHNSYYGRGDGDFLLDEVECDGSEKSIDQCGHRTWKTHDCHSFEVAAVHCTKEVDECKAAREFTCAKDKSCVSLRAVCDGTCQCRDCSDEKTCVSVVELVGGSSPSEGRVEIVLNGIRGTICDDHFDDVDATVVCKSLGYGYGSLVKQKELFGQGQGLIWMDDVECVGNESDIVRCPYKGPLDQDCGHDEDVAVVCRAADAENCFSVASEYTGPTNYTTSGHTCQAWASNSPHRHKYDTGSYFPDKSVQAAGNKCRSPDNDETPWCFTTNAYVLWEYCNVSKCVENCFSVAFEYAGPTDYTTSGHTCQAWASNSPHRHKYHDTDSYFPEKTVQAAGNKCRAPDNDPIPWCYTTNANVRWEYCNVSRCAGGAFNFSSSCGIRPLENKDDIPYSYGNMRRIYGGTNATYGFIPWQAAVRIHVDWFGYYIDCGGTIIDEYWVVSAAHCFEHTIKDWMDVRTGDLISKQPDEYEQAFKVEKLIIHELYNFSVLDYDIALLKLRPINGHGISFNDYVLPACLPDVTTPYHPGQNCLISGWGKHENGNQSTHLKEASVPIVDASTCNELYNQKNITITSNMVCAGPLRGGTDTCKGDSGGPLVCKINDKYTLMGVTSFGALNCGEPYAPGVYAKVSRFVPWIRNRLSQYS